MRTSFKKIRISLRIKLALTIGTLIIVLVTATGMAMIGQEEEALHREFHERGRALATDLATYCAGAFIANDISALRYYVNNVAKQNHVKYVIVFDEDRKVVMHSDLDEAGKVYSDSKSIEAVNSEKVITREYPGDDGESNICDIVAPIEASGIRVGTIRLGYSQTGIDSEIGYAERRLLFILIGMIFAGLSLALLLANFISKPVEQLTKATQRISSGDLNVEIKANTRDEIGELANSFNKMTINLNQLISQLQELFIDTVKAFVEAIEAKDPYTRGHSENVTKYAMAIADKINLSEIEREALRTASLLHDIGKIGIKEEILNKSSGLSSEDYDSIKQHPHIAVQIMGQIPLLNDVVAIVFHHHERYDGKGYPRGIKGKEIPLGSRILAVADAFDAMTSTRPYRPAADWDSAIRELKKNSGKQFDPEIISVFLEILTSQRLQVLS